ncbi:MAG: S8 family serine peptidase [Chloroflexi bacterium]|nr:S8 family serine peptidase [Chloroflexota bacterium]
MTRALPWIALLAGLALAATVLPHVRAQGTSYPDDPYFSQQWYLHNTGQDGGVPGADIHALEAWSITRCSSRVTIALIDTGVDPAQPDLAAKLVAGAAFGTGDNSTADDFGHGTETAGVAAAASDNGIGVAGVCPLGRIMPIRIAQIADSSYDHINSFRVASAIRWATNHGARIVSMSIGVDDTPELRAATAYAYNHGVVLVAAAGNTGGQFSGYPADDPHVLAVGGTDNQDRRWVGSSYGPNSDFVLAPARDIVTTARGGQYAAVSGTSFATRQVAGLAALVLSVRPDLTADQVVWAIERGADHVQGQSAVDEQDGWGRINCYRTLQIAQGMAVATPSETPAPTDTPTPPLVTSLALTATTRRPGQREALQVLTRPGARISTHIVYANLSSADRAGRADSSGHYRYTWRVPGIRGRVVISITVTTADGGLSRLRRRFRIE